MQGTTRCNIAHSHCSGCPVGVRRPVNLTTVLGYPAPRTLERTLGTLHREPYSTLTAVLQGGAFCIIVCSPL